MLLPENLGHDPERVKVDGTPGTVDLSEDKVRADLGTIRIMPR